MRKENLITRDEFRRLMELIHDSGMSKSMFAMKAGINPTYFLRVINKGKMSRKMYQKIMEVAG